MTRHIEMNRLKENDEEINILNTNIVIMDVGKNQLRKLVLNFIEHEMI